MNIVVPINKTIVCQTDLSFELVEDYTDEIIFIESKNSSRLFMRVQRKDKDDNLCLPQVND